MPLPTSASDVTETIKNAVLGNGAVAQAARAASGAPVKVSRNVAISSRPASAIASIVKTSTVARSLGFAPPVSSGSPAPKIGTVSAHTGSKTTIAVSTVNYDLYTFLSTGANTFVVSDGNVTADIFVLGGGGHGAWGGGGGGGLSITSNVSIPAGTYTVTVGAGASRQSAFTVGSNGGDSTITVSGSTYRGVGGGSSTKNGGCGGGNGGIGSQGFNGGDAGAFSGGGGGGMGAAGSGFNGGAGIESTFSGTNVTYGGGGGGGLDSGVNSSLLANGGAGGGGNGGWGGTGGGSDGTNGLGGGGGGNNKSFLPQGNGGHGRVMIRIRK